MGWIMGGMMLRTDLDSSVDKVLAKDRDAVDVSEEQARQEHIHQDEFRDAEVL